MFDMCVVAKHRNAFLRDFSWRKFGVANHRQINSAPKGAWQFEPWTIACSQKSLSMRIYDGLERRGQSVDPILLWLHPDDFVRFKTDCAKVFVTAFAT
jgi:hypothetical protein